jgi:hypothetical protein
MPSLPAGVTRSRSVLVFGILEPSYTASEDIWCLWCGRTIAAGEAFTSPPLHNASRAPASDPHAPSLHTVCGRCRPFQHHVG